MSATAAQAELDRLLESAERKERQARQRALLYTAIPIVMAIALLAWTTIEVRQAMQQVDSAQAEAARFRAEAQTQQAEVDRLMATVLRLNEELDAAQEKLADAAALGKYVHPIDFVDLKAIASRNPGTASVLARILSLKDQGVGWRLGGTSPEDGFDSPGFAAFVLKAVGAGLDLGSSERELLARSRELYDRLTRVSEPQPGDLVFYPSGYALFHFLDANGRPFVIGMTPLGITALEPDFAQPVGFRRWRR